MVGRALVVVVDDRTAHGGEEDHSGPLVTELLGEAGFLVDGVVVVSADEVEIRNALNTAVIGGGVDLVISVGGTGVSPRDVTPPEATVDILDRELLGISEALRASGLSAGIIDAGVSRGGLAGISGSTLVVNIAGSRAAVRDGMATLGPPSRARSSASSRAWTFSSVCQIRNMLVRAREGRNRRPVALHACEQHRACDCDLSHTWRMM